jgi:hypothetical protein
MIGMLKFFPLGSWHLMVGLLSIIYSALIIQFFVDRYEPRITSLQELLDHDWEIGISPHDNLLTNYLDKTFGRKPVLTKLRERMVEYELQSYLDFYPGPNEAYIQEVTLLSLKALYVKQTDYEKWRQTYLVVDTENFPRFFRSFLFRKNFPGLPGIKQTLQRFVEAGLYQHYANVWVGDLDKRLGYQDLSLTTAKRENTVVVTMAHVNGVFIVYVCGIALSIVVLVGELLWAQWEKRRAAPSKCVNIELQNIV